MKQTNNDFCHRARVGRSDPTGAVSRVVGTAAQGPSASVFTLSDCSLCGDSFALDMEEERGSLQEEVVVEGREFLGIHHGSVLCPRCLHYVEVTGADRMYWRLAHC